MTTSNLNLNYPWLDNNDNKEVECCICQGREPSFSVFKFILNRIKYDIKKCPVDGLMYLNPQPKGKYLDILYNHPSYFSGQDDMYGLYIDDEKSRQIAKIRLAEIISYAKDTKSLLEIGSAYGHLLVEAKNNGFGQVVGVEFSDKALNLCRKSGLVVAKDLNDLDKQTYDVIALYSVIEHLVDPAKFLNQLNKFCRAQTLIFIRVPKMSESGPWLSLLDHFWHFNEGSLARLLDYCGYEIIETFPSGKFLGIKYPGVLESFTAVCRLKNAPLS